MIRRRWTDYHPTYRAPQMRSLAGWIAAGQSGSLVGMGGSGKSNLLGFLAHRPEVLAGYLPDGTRALAVLVDLNSLPAGDLSTVYRLILRSFHDARDRLDAPLAAEIEQVFAAQLSQRDPFVVQTALQNWLTHLTGSGLQVALVMDRFERFAEQATPELSGSLRALRDAFKGRLCLIAGMRQPVIYLPDPSQLGEMQELLDTCICWVGPMVDADARRMVGEETRLASPPPTESELEALVELTGGYPALLKAACHWWSEGGRALPRGDWDAALEEVPALRARLDEIWEGLSLAEQAVLAVLASRVRRPTSAPSPERFGPEQAEPVGLLAAKGLLATGLDGNGVAATGDEASRTDSAPAETNGSIRGSLLARRAAGDAGRNRGGLRLDPSTGEPFLGGRQLHDLTNLERGALVYLLDRPRQHVPKTELIEGVWPDDVVEGGIMDDALYQVVRGLRRKIEPEPGRPRYLVTWRGRPEGGYQLFPEGRPG